jgi:hypothetical protein
MSETATAAPNLAFKAYDKLDRLYDDNLARLAVLERLCWLMAANEADDNNQFVDFGGVREEDFWRGLQELAEAAAQATENIRMHTNELYDVCVSAGAAPTPKGGA